MNLIKVRIHIIDLMVLLLGAGLGVAIGIGLDGTEGICKLIFGLLGLVIGYVVVCLSRHLLRKDKQECGRK